MEIVGVQVQKFRGFSKTASCLIERAENDLAF
jgi:hypothetical protein